MNPTYSRLLPASAGKLSHVRILTVERSAARAEYLFELFKEKTF